MSNDANHFLVILFLLLIVLNESKLKLNNLIKSNISLITMLAFGYVAYLFHINNGPMFTLAVGLSVYSGVFFLDKNQFDLGSLSLIGACLVVPDIYEKNNTLLVLSVLFSFSRDNSLIGKIVNLLLFLCVLLDQFRINLNQNILSSAVLLIVVIYALIAARRSERLGTFNVLYFLTGLAVLNQSLSFLSQPVLLTMVISTIVLLRTMAQKNINNVVMLLIASMGTLTNSNLSWVFVILFVLYSELGGKIENSVFKSVNINNLLSTTLLTIVSIPILGWWSLLLSIVVGIILIDDEIELEAIKLSYAFYIGLSIVVTALIVMLLNSKKYELFAIFPLCVLIFYLIEKYCKKQIIDNLTLKLFKTNYFKYKANKDSNLVEKKLKETNEVAVVRFKYNLVSITLFAMTGLLLTIIWNNKWN